jgi:hypothetical protein
LPSKKEFIMTNVFVAKIGAEAAMLVFLSSATGKSIRQPWSSAEA